jgi:3-isopropylmalate dehydrogenase
MREGLKVLDVLQQHTATKFELDHDDCGGCSLDKHGVPITQAVLEKSNHCDAVLFGSAGGPEWGHMQPNPEAGLLHLREYMNAFANVRPCKIYAESLVSRSPLKEEIVKGVDFIVLRENCGGAYYGPKIEDYEKGIASDLWVYTVPEIERIGRISAALAKQRGEKLVWSTDKANVLANSRLWRKTMHALYEKEFPDLELRDQLADSLSMLMVVNPRKFNGVIVADNTFGDMLSDEAGGVVGTLGTLPSASLCGIPELGKPVKGIYEPIHGSAPDIAGQGKVNPTAQILSLSMLLRYSCCLYKEADAIDAAIERVLNSKSMGGLEIRTGDLGGTAGTSEFGDAVCEVLKEILGHSNANGHP